jgi:redox-sensing transcriptional repressor
MANDELKFYEKIPEPTLRRLPWYLAYVKLLKGKGDTMVSSTQIAKEISVDASQVAKDLSCVNISGKTRVGYEIDALVDILEDFLGFTSQHKAFLFGVGRLGAALMRDSGLNQYGVEIVAGFDIREDLTGTKIDGIPVFSMKTLPQKQKEYEATIGIITVPVEKAQEVTDFVVENGIKALWNFTPFRIRAPKQIVVQNTSIYAHLAVMFNRMNVVRGVRTGNGAHRANDPKFSE